MSLKPAKNAISRDSCLAFERLDAASSAASRPYLAGHPVRLYFLLEGNKVQRGGGIVGLEALDDIACGYRNFGS